MNNPHFIKVFSHMYHLHKRNISAYFKPMRNPCREPVVENSIHWVGHATTVINLEGNIIVTDPVTIPHIGHIKRLVKPSMDLSSTKIDYILISHGHMDHLDYFSLGKLDKNAIVIAPKNFITILSFLGFHKIISLNPMENYQDDSITIQCFAAVHDGRRYYVGSTSPSSSFLVKGKIKSVFFAGDTAYTENYKEIKADIALMPVGCYKPKEYEKMHCSPEQSFMMFSMMNAKYMVPIHYKTFILAQDNDDETYKILKKLNNDSIKIIDIGQTVKF